MSGREQNIRLSLGGCCSSDTLMLFKTGMEGD